MNNTSDVTTTNGAWIDDTQGCTTTSTGPGTDHQWRSETESVSYDETTAIGLPDCSGTNFWSGSYSRDNFDESTMPFFQDDGPCEHPICGATTRDYHYSDDHYEKTPVFTNGAWGWSYSAFVLNVDSWNPGCSNFVGTVTNNTPDSGIDTGFPAPNDYFGGDLLTQTATSEVRTNSDGSTVTRHLDNEYTDEMLNALLSENATNYGGWVDGPDIAYALIDETHTGRTPRWGPAWLYKVKYRLGVDQSSWETNVTYTITWDEITLYLPFGEWTSTPRSETVSWSPDGLWTKEYEMIPPFNPNNCACGILSVYQFPADFTVTRSQLNDVPGTGGFAAPDSLACPSCTRPDSTPSQALNARFSVGQTLLATPLPSLSLSAPAPDPISATPAGLSFNNSDAATEVYSDANGLRQIKAPQALVDIVTNSPFSYDLKFYHVSQAGIFSNSLYQPTGSPFVTWRIENPDASPTNYYRLRLTEFRDSIAYTNEGAYTNSVGWTITGSGGLVQRQFALGAYDSTDETFQFTNIIRKPGGNDVQREVRKYQKFIWGLAPVEKTADPEGNPKTTSYSYHFWADMLHGLPLKQTVLPDGSWTWRDAADSFGRVKTVYRSFGDQPAPGYSAPSSSNVRLTSYHFGNEAGSQLPNSGDDGTIFSNTARYISETLQNYDVGRHWTIFPTNESGYLRIDAQSTIPNTGDWSDPSNLFKTNLFYSTGPNQGRPKSTVNENGTLITYDYADDPAGQYRTNFTASGAPDPTFTYVIDGTTNISVINLGGFPVLSLTKDILSGITLSQDIYSSFDEFGRPGTVTHLDGTSEETTYACCGVDTTTDRDGVTTQYLRDAAKRQTAQITRGITVSNVLDAASHTLKTIRIGRDSSQIVQNQSGYNLAGDLIKQTNALNGVTSISEGKDPTTGGLIRTNIYPDGGTRIEFFYLDGQIKRVAGTAANPMLYFYGIEDYGATGNSDDDNRPYTLEIKLDSSGGTNEWTKTYTDPAGRIYKTMYADATPDDLSDNPYEKTWFNNKGQQWKQRDPDGVTTFTTYNAKGERAYAIVAMSDTTTGISDYGTLLSSLSSLLSGNDRISYVTNDVYHDGVLGDVRRTRSYVWPTNNSDFAFLTSTVLTSTDGLHSWQISFGLTNESVTVFAGSGYRYTTNWTPDRSYSVSVMRYGTNVSSAHFDSINNQLSSINYLQDAHGRPAVSIDARNGGTTNTFNAMDEISGTYTPGGQHTSSVFDTSGRSTATFLTDFTIAYNAYNPMGLVTNAYGSRVYPVSYGFDAQARMSAMTTYKNFAAHSGAATTTWNFDPYRGWLSSKYYPDNTGPTYAYSAAGPHDQPRLGTRRREHEQSKSSRRNIWHGLQRRRDDRARQHFRSGGARGYEPSRFGTNHSRIQ